MAKRGRPPLYTIPPHRAFADALVAGILATYGHDLETLARGQILVPNNRATTALTAAFIRQAEKGLLLPRFVTIGDLDHDERAGLGLDGGSGDDIPPAVDPLIRQMIIARLLQEQDPGLDTAQAVRLAGDLAHTLDQLTTEGVAASQLHKIDQNLAEGLPRHWQTSLATLSLIIDRWPAECATLGRIDVADRRNRLLIRAAQRWTAEPPAGFVIAAGIGTVAPAVVHLLKTISRLRRGQIVFAGLDLTMPDREWDAIRGTAEDAPLDTHPQAHLALLLSQLDYGRADVKTWRWGSEGDARAVRSRAISNAMAPAECTGKWETLETKDRSLAGVVALELATPAHEAQAIALALRERIETPGQTAALVTPDRALATRVSAHLARWGIEADDSAGQPLSTTLPGTLILALADAISDKFAPVSLLALLKHQMVQAGSGRAVWLDGARLLDLALRGPRPGPGLSGIDMFLDTGDARARQRREAVQPWWGHARDLLAPFETMPQTSGEAIAALREGLVRLAGDDMWQGTAGQLASTLFEGLERAALYGPQVLRAESLPTLLRTIMDAVAVRPVFGGHPRIFIWGLLEAQLQSTSLMVLGGLNEGVWPALPAPDPWLAPAIRRILKLPGLERRIGLSAHDLGGALGSPDVLLTRAKRDTSAPTIASRFWLRLEAMAGKLPQPTSPYAAWALQIDRPGGSPLFAPRPAPCPPVADRPHTISVTEVDMLTADPYAFYARKMLTLSALDAVDAEPGPSWRGSLVHDVLEHWAKDHHYRPDRLVPLMREMFAAQAIHPLLCALWLPRLDAAAQWIADEVANNRANGRVPLVAEQSGATMIGKIKLQGRVDRIDRQADGTLAVIDYKTGSAPSKKQVGAGFAGQLGLNGLIADRGGFTGVSGISAAFEYWSLARSRADDRGFGKLELATGTKDGHIAPAVFVHVIEARFRETAAKWLTGNAPFTAKLHPEYAFGDYDHLMRFDEWNAQ